jgi:hypothetical protein
MIRCQIYKLNIKLQVFVKSDLININQLLNRLHFSDKNI